MIIKNAQNLQCNDRVHIRMSEEDDGSVTLTLVQRSYRSSAFKFLATIIVPETQRENMANYLRIEKEVK